MIHFTCSKCGENIEAPESIRGENLKCPKCGRLQRVSGENPDLMKPLGNVEPICPYCNKSLEKKPKRRSKCPHCGNYFRIRTRPQDRQQVLVTEEQAEEIAKQYWSGYGRDPENWLQEKRRDWDRQWGELNKQSMENTKNGLWGMYRNCRLDMVKVLNAEADFTLYVLDCTNEEKYKMKAMTRMKQALRMLMEVTLFDLNGANNNNEFKPYENKIQLWNIASVVIDWIIDLTKKLGIQQSNLREIFYEVAELYKSFSFPLTTNESWKRFEEALIDYDAIVAAYKKNNKSFNDIKPL
jgi:DNA-directed RNA polymerase subunit RPC12/RpoP